MGHSADRWGPQNSSVGAPESASDDSGAVLAGRAQWRVRPKTPTWAIRALVVAKRSARSTRIKTLIQIRHIGFTAADDLQVRFRGVSPPAGSGGRRLATPSDVLSHATLGFV
jgi:hypothetical protein